MKRSRLISIETESDSNTFWSWYSTQEFPKHTNTNSAQTYITHNMRLAAANLQQCVKFLWQQYCYERILYMCIPINVYDMITTWYNFSFLFKLSVLLMKWMMYVSSIINYIFTMYGIWNNAIIDHTYNSLVEKFDEHNNTMRKYDL